MSPLEDSHSRRQFIGALAKVSGALPLLVTRGSAAAPSLQRIGFLIRAGYPQLVDAFSGELARLGHIDGETIVIEKRFSQPDLSDLPAQAAELVRSDVALILASSLPQALAVRRAAPNMPMVIATCAGMVSNGFAKSVDHPGGNATGGSESSARHESLRAGWRTGRADDSRAFSATCSWRASECSSPTSRPSAFPVISERLADCLSKP